MTRAEKFAAPVQALALEPVGEPRTPLGRKLWELRRRIEASGIPLLDREELSKELMERRGERNS